MNKNILKSANKKCTLQVLFPGKALTPLYRNAINMGFTSCCLSLRGRGQNNKINEHNEKHAQIKTNVICTVMTGKVN